MAESPTEPTPAPDDAAPDAAFHCPPGLECGGKWLTEDPQYTAMDLFWMFVGVSSRPVRFKKYCAKCNHPVSVSEPRRPY